MIGRLRVMKKEYNDKPRSIPSLLIVGPYSSYLSYQEKRENETVTIMATSIKSRHYCWNISTTIII